MFGNNNNNINNENVSQIRTEEPYRIPVTEYIKNRHKAIKKKYALTDELNPSEPYNVPHQYITEVYTVYVNGEEEYYSEAEMQDNGLLKCVDKLQKTNHFLGTENTEQSEINYYFPIYEKDKECVTHFKNFTKFEKKQL